MNKTNIGKEMSENYQLFEIVFWTFDIEDENELLKDLKERKIFNQKNLKLEMLGANLLKTLDDETDGLSLIIRSHLYIERILDYIIEKKFKYHNSILKEDFTFYKKLLILKSKNYLQNQMFLTIKYINTIRNKYAHNLDYNIANFDLSLFPYCEDVYSSLKTTNINIKKEAHIFILKYIIYNLLINLTKKHPYISELKNDEV